MENTFTLQQVRCPNCQATISSFDPFSDKLTCPYCSTVSVITGAMQKEAARPERIIPFSTSRDAFELACANMLINEPLVPDDIFEQVSFGDVDAIYLPMFLYEGTFEANWSASIGYEENSVGVGTDWQGNKTVKEKKVIKYRPASGTSKGNFSFVCLGYEGPEITEEMSAFTKTFPYATKLSKEFSSEYLKGYHVMPHNDDRESVWAKYGEELVDANAREAALGQVGSEIFKDFRSSTNHDKKHEGRMVYVPFWFVYYKYNGQNYHYLMDGIGQNQNGTTPTDQPRQDKVNKLKRIPKFVLWGSIALMLLVFVPKAGPILFSLGILGIIGYFVVKMIMKKKVNTLFDESRAKRQAAFDALK